MPRLLTILLTCLLLFCCSDSKDSSTPLPENALANQIKPDAINMASIGWRTSTRDAILLAEKQINEAGGVLGKPFNAITVVARNNSEAQEFGEELMSNGVQLINVSTSTRTLNLSDFAIATDSILISESSSSPSLTTASDDDRIFRIGVSDVHAVPVLADVAAANGTVRAVVMQNEGDAFGNGINSLFTPAFEQRSGEVVGSVLIPFGVESGFDSYIQSALEFQPDVILNAILNAEISASLVSELVANGFSGLVLLPGTAAGNQNFIDNLANPEAIIGGARGSAANFGNYSDPNYLFFETSYLNQFGISPPDFTAATYDIAIAFALATEHAGRLNNTNEPSGTMVRDSLRAIMNPPGTKMGPTNLADALQMIRDGSDIDYTGAFADIEWDNNGDIVGDITFTVFNLDAVNRRWDSSEQIVISIP